MKSNEWRVIVDRGIDLDPMFRENDTRIAALRRVRALCELHSCDFTEYETGRVMIVHAGSYYNRNRKGS
jgi:hypothetical protein